MSDSSALPVQIAPPPAGWGAQRATRNRPDPDRLATQSLIFGAVSIAVNLLLLPSIIGIVYGRRALRQGTSQRATATAGIVTAVIGLVSVVVQLAIAIPLLLLTQAAQTAAQHELETGIVSSMAKQGLALSDVTCPKVTDVSVGTALTCTGKEDSGAAVRIDVQVVEGDRYSIRVSRAG